MSDGAILRGNPHELARVSELLSRGAEDLRAGLSDLDAEVSRMLDGWRGSSGGRYGAAWRQWHEGTERIRAGLSVMAALVGQASGGYDEQEAASSTALRGVAQ